MDCWEAGGPPPLDVEGRKLSRVLCYIGRGDVMAEEQEAERSSPNTVEQKGGKAVAMWMACELEVWACALLRRWWWLRFGYGG